MHGKILVYFGLWKTDVREGTVRLAGDRSRHWYVLLGLTYVGLGT